MADSEVMCLSGCRLFVVEVNVIRQETAWALNTAGWTLPVCLFVPPSFCLTFICPPAVQSQTLSLSLFYTCCAVPLPAPFLSLSPCQPGEPLLSAHITFFTPCCSQRSTISTVGSINISSDRSWFSSWSTLLWQH